MTPRLTTKRLTLRPIGGEADIDAIAHWLSDVDVARWLTAVPWPYRRGDARHFVDTILPGDPSSLHWAIDAGAGLIGLISVKPDLGYWLGRPFHGRGYMSEAVTAVLAHARQIGETRVLSSHFPGNQASRKVLIKAGFQDTHRETVTRARDDERQQLQCMALDLSLAKGRPQSA